MRSGIGYVVDS